MSPWRPVLVQYSSILFLWLLAFCRHFCRRTFLHGVQSSRPGVLFPMTWRVGIRTEVQKQAYRRQGSTARHLFFGVWWKTCILFWSTSRRTGNIVVSILMCSMSFLYDGSSIFYREHLFYVNLSLSSIVYHRHLHFSFYFVLLIFVDNGILIPVFCIHSVVVFCWPWCWCSFDMVHIARKAWRILFMPGIIYLWASTKDWYSIRWYDFFKYMTFICSMPLFLLYFCGTNCIPLSYSNGRKRRTLWYWVYEHWWLLLVFYSIQAFCIIRCSSFWYMTYFCTCTAVFVYSIFYSIFLVFTYIILFYWTIFIIVFYFYILFNMSEHPMYYMKERYWRWHLFYSISIQMVYLWYYIYEEEKWHEKKRKRTDIFHSILYMNIFSIFFFSSFILFISYIFEVNLYLHQSSLFFVHLFLFWRRCRYFCRYIFDLFAVDLFVHSVGIFVPGVMAFYSYKRGGATCDERRAGGGGVMNMCSIILLFWLTFCFIHGEIRYYYSILLLANIKTETTMPGILLLFRTWSVLLTTSLTWPWCQGTPSCLLWRRTGRGAFVPSCRSFAVLFIRTSRRPVVLFVLLLPALWWRPRAVPPPSLVWRYSRPAVSGKARRPTTLMKGRRKEEERRRRRRAGGRRYLPATCPACRSCQPGGRFACTCRARLPACLRAGPLPCRAGAVGLPFCCSFAAAMTCCSCCSCCCSGRSFCCLLPPRTCRGCLLPPVACHACRGRAACARRCWYMPTLTTTAVPAGLLPAASASTTYNVKVHDDDGSDVQAGGRGRRRWCGLCRAARLRAGRRDDVARAVSLYFTCLFCSLPPWKAALMPTLTTLTRRKARARATAAARAVVNGIVLNIFHTGIPTVPLFDALFLLYMRDVPAFPGGRTIPVVFCIYAVDGDDGRPRPWLLYSILFVYIISGMLLVSVIILPACDRWWSLPHYCSSILPSSTSFCTYIYFCGIVGFSIFLFIFVHFYSTTWHLLYFK